MVIETINGTWEEKGEMRCRDSDAPGLLFKQSSVQIKFVPSL